MLSRDNRLIRLLYEFCEGRHFMINDFLHFLHCDWFLLFCLCCFKQGCSPLTELDHFGLGFLSFFGFLLKERLYLSF